MMNKLLAMLVTFFPVIALADGSLSFTPPASDYSVVFLSNVFGIVDGVLHGTGSQMMGAMFSVFNAAVLALGGIIIMYTLLVSTMNTAHQGEMLGKQWSSIWIPVRATMGLALLIPKASGYCLMQIFVMWVVVQGVGAADKVWDAALSYLNRGGSIIQAQEDPTATLLSGGTSPITVGAEVMLAGQVCMLGLQNQLQNQLQIYQSQLQSKSGPCAGTPSEAMKAFCTSTVPNFISSVNAVDIQTNLPTATTFTVPMPNFTQQADKPYFFLNGICGTLTWNAFQLPNVLIGPSQKNNSTNNNAPPQGNTPFLTPAELKAISMSRAIAIQQMYMDLSTVAQILVGNDPLLGSVVKNTNVNPSATDLPPFVSQQLGVPKIPGGTVCSNNTTPNCILWGSDPTYSSGPLFNGTEFSGAIQDYNAVMLPSLNLVAQAHSNTNAQSSRAFIEAASTEGWIMAGSYFFDLVNLNVQASANASLTDTNTGLQTSSINLTLLEESFSNSSCSPSSQYQTLCIWFNNVRDSVDEIRMLIDGSNAPGLSTPLPMPTLSSPQRPVEQGVGALTVYGYINNATILQLPNQPGFQPLQFAGAIHVAVDTTNYYLPVGSFACGSINLGLTSPCIGRDFGNLFYNDIFRVMYNFFLKLFGQFINQAIMAFLELPLEGMAKIFANGLTIIDTPGANPVVALAKMGTYYINYAANLWLALIEMSVVASLIPIFGIFIFALISMTMPIILAWMGIMLQIGFSTAYYVPILPYMIFTFGSIGWLMAVIEAMVAAPIVALGITHPEGHDAFGKGEQAVMILMNVFLRPAMMIIGYIAGIALTYVSVWIINAGFDNAIGFVQGSAQFGTVGSMVTPSGTTVYGGYVGWAGIFAYFFSILIYTMMYLVVVQKSFTLIALLPDKVLRWIGGSPESWGQDSSGWGQEVQGKIAEAGKDTAAGQAQMDKQLTASASKAMGKGEGGGGGGKASGKGGGGKDGGKDGGDGGGDAGPSAGGAPGGE